MRNSSPSEEKPSGFGNRNLLSAGVLVDHLEQLVVHRLPLVRRPGTNGVGCAVREVICAWGPGDGSERLLRRGNLRENIGAVAILFDHALDAADLTFNPAQLEALISLSTPTALRPVPGSQGQESSLTVLALSIFFLVVISSLGEL